jgi:hypothetical protein
MSKFQSFWFGEDLPPYQRLAMKSFADFGHDYALYAYKKFDVPAGIELRDASEILPQARVFFYGARAGVGRGSVAVFSNLFRYHMLHRMGGWWVDTDVICLSNKLPAGETFMGWEDESLIGNAIMKFPKEHSFVATLRDAAESAGTDVRWGETGPDLLTRMACKHGLLVSPQATTYPVLPKDALRILIPQHREDIRDKTRQASFLHLWNEVMRRAVIFTWMAPPPGSFIAELFERHGVNFGEAPAYTAEQIQRLNENYSTFTFGGEHAQQSKLLQSQLEALQSQLEALQSQLELRNVETMRLGAEFTSARQNADGLAHELAHLRAKMAAVQTSTSWRLTAPVRHVADLVRSWTIRASSQ